MLKKAFLIIIIACSFVFATFTNILIDFDQVAEWTSINPKDNYQINSNQGTESKEMEFAKRALSVDQSNCGWVAELNSSANFIQNRKLSYVRAVDCDLTKSSTPAFTFKSGKQQGKVLGVRANFPVSDSGAYVTIRPKWPIPFYAGADGKAFLSNGMIDNFGPMKQIRAWVKGKAFPNSFFVNLRDQDGKLSTYKLGNVAHFGWKMLVYENRNYLDNVRDREIYNLPAYPRVIPVTIFDSMVFYKDGTYGYDGDFIAYVAYIEILNDKAKITVEDDIIDEDVWEISKKREETRKAWEKDRYKRASELEDLERKKMNLQPIYSE